MAKKSRSERKTGRVKAARAVERGLPTAVEESRAKVASRRGTVRSSGQGQREDASLGMPMVAKVALGAAFALALVYVLSQLRK